MIGAGRTAMPAASSQADAAAFAPAAGQSKPKKVPAISNITVAVDAMNRRAGSKGTLEIIGIALPEP
jgi:hypothetical protein